MPIHLVNPLTDISGDTERSTLMLYRLLRPHADTFLWSTGSHDPRIAGHPLRTIRPFQGEFPQGGTLFLIGTYYSPGLWLQHARPLRVIVGHNAFTNDSLLRMLMAIEQAGCPEPEIAYASKLLKEFSALEGRIAAEPIDLREFSPAPGSENSPFTIGRLSRDLPFMHHPDDLSLYRMLARSGCRIRVLGGNCLSPALQSDDEGIELLSTGAEKAPDFLRTLDCFFYRTGDWRESSARIIAEAMACGLPVVACRNGAYREWIEHGANGLLFDTQEDAFDHILRLRNDPALRMKIGRNARRTAEALWSEEALQSTIEWYLA